MGNFATIFHKRELMDAIVFDLVVLFVAVSVPVAISLLLYWLVRNFFLHKSRGEVLPSVGALASLVMRENGGESEGKTKVVQDYWGAKGGDGQKGSVVKKNTDYLELCKVILLSYKGYDERLDVMRFLFDIAYADGRQSKKSRKLLSDIAGFINVDDWDYSVLEWSYEENMKEDEIRSKSYQDKINEAYLVIGASPNCSDEELELAYNGLKINDDDKISGNDGETKKRRSRQIEEAYSFLVMVRSKNE